MLGIALNDISVQSKISSLYEQVIVLPLMSGVKGGPKAKRLQKLFAIKQKRQKTSLDMQEGAAHI